MSKERARRRAEREVAQAAEAERRTAAAEREARRDVRRERLTGWLPSSTPAPGRQRGALAEKRRRQVLATLALLVVVNLLLFAVARDPALSGLLLVASVLGAPIVHMMMFRRT
ncbi:hypothetical protein [Nocardioides flavescens]|uniref:Uncharacterized protein n=1 Tax=Nocardioides flavescens TaxID=2691959 RepID=A0A6L7F185_9ACTN|nr:hypothetical protein [Nocardioides flavescens]MXG91095.1 hypothetical protein [Nocardioides flavescens]